MQSAVVATDTKFYVRPLTTVYKEDASIWVKEKRGQQLFDGVSHDDKELHQIKGTALSYQGRTNL